MEWSFTKTKRVVLCCSLSIINILICTACKEDSNPAVPDTQSDRPI